LFEPQINGSASSVDYHFLILLNYAELRNVGVNLMQYIVLVLTIEYKHPIFI